MAAIANRLNIRRLLVSGRLLEAVAATSEKVDEEVDKEVDEEVDKEVDKKVDKEVEMDEV